MSVANDFFLYQFWERRPAGQVRVFKDYKVIFRNNVISKNLDLVLEQIIFGAEQSISD